MFINLYESLWKKIRRSILHNSSSLNPAKEAVANGRVTVLSFGLFGIDLAEIAISPRIHLPERWILYHPCKDDSGVYSRFIMTTVDIKLTPPLSMAFRRNHEGHKEEIFFSFVLLVSFVVPSLTSLSGE